jgi:integrase-like protein
MIDAASHTPVTSERSRTRRIPASGNAALAASGLIQAALGVEFFLSGLKRMVRTIRSECLDHIIVINERHLQAVLAEFAHYYNHDRPRRSLRLQTPIVTPTLPTGRVVSRSVLGGLHHVYARAA